MFAVKSNCPDIEAYRRDMSELIDSTLHNLNLHQVCVCVECGGGCALCKHVPYNEFSHKYRHKLAYSFQKCLI